MNVSINIPKHIIDNILSFGDPIITSNYKLCMNQLLYNKKEFDFLRTSSRKNSYYNWKEYNFKTFILIRSNQKKKLNYNNIIKPIISTPYYIDLLRIYY